MSNSDSSKVDDLPATARESVTSIAARILPIGVPQPEHLFAQSGPAPFTSSAPCASAQVAASISPRVSSVRAEPIPPLSPRQQVSNRSRPRTSGGYGDAPRAARLRERARASFQSPADDHTHQQHLFPVNSSAAQADTWALVAVIAAVMRWSSKRRFTRPRVESRSTWKVLQHGEDAPESTRCADV